MNTKNTESELEKMVAKDVAIDHKPIVEGYEPYPLPINTRKNKNNRTKK